jgi:hypothetical protein
MNSSNIFFLAASLSLVTTSILAQDYHFIVRTEAVPNVASGPSESERKSAWASYAESNGLTCPSGCSDTDWSSIVWAGGGVYSDFPVELYPSSNPERLIVGKHVDYMDPNPHEITTLDSLLSIQTVGSGGFYLYGGSYPDLNGLSNLTRVEGTVRFQTGDLSGPGFNDISGISNLIYVGGDFTIQESSQTATGNSFENLEEVGGDFNFPSGVDVFSENTKLHTIGGSFKVTGTSDLMDISGLSKVKGIGGSLYLHQRNISDLSPLSLLESIGGDFSIFENPIDDLKPIENIILSGVLSLDDKTYSASNKMSGSSPMCIKLNNDPTMLMDKTTGGNKIPVSKVCNP